MKKDEKNNRYGQLLRVSLRAGAVYVPETEMATRADITYSTLALVKQLRQAGFAVSEPLLHALNAMDVDRQVELLSVINEVMGIGLNWAPMVKGWQTPTGETFADHLLTYIANVWNSIAKDKSASIPGVTLPCGHLIPEGTFPLERYNGCPFCGTPFTFDTNIYKGQGSKLRTLELWGDSDIEAHYKALLGSPVALDATQVESLKTLIALRPLPADVKISMKETLMLVIDMLVEQDKDAEAGTLMSTPTDVLRYLWYDHTGLLQLVRPSTLLRRALRAGTHHTASLARQALFLKIERKKLRLKYDRRWCRRVAGWLNSQTLPLEAACEAMHPQREMWVRFIRALRLAETARRPGMERLRELLDRFYNKRYEVWAGKVSAAREANDADRALTLLKQRPGVMARTLFANMLWLGPEPVLAAFKEVAPQLPPRLLLTLGSYADAYFTHTGYRVVRPPMSTAAKLPPNPLLALHDKAEREAMARAVGKVYEDTMQARFAALPHAEGTVYIDPQLYNVPMAVGDRSATIQDVNAALQGMRFPVEGDKVRLFMQWGKGLPAQHLDMDLSAAIIYENSREDCGYFNLTAIGAQHSGDIINIPNMVGTAEYVELDVPVLAEAGARYVAFTCNAYSTGMINPGLVIGWMDSANKMEVNEKTGVAYDPSTVQHMVRVTKSSDKGLVFGVLDVAAREIVWLELPFRGQNVLSLDFATVDAYVKKLASKVSIGRLLALRAQAQGMTVVETPEGATEAYTAQWALDTAAVAALLL